MYNGGFSNVELPVLVRNSTYVAQILCGLSHKVSTFITKLGITGYLSLFWIYPPLYTSRISCYVVTTSKIGLYEAFIVKIPVIGILEFATYSFQNKLSVSRERLRK